MSKDNYTEKDTGRRLHRSIITGTLLLVISVACGIIVPKQVAPSETETPITTIIPTQTVTPAPTAKPTITPIPVTRTPRPTETPKFAPFCGPESTLPSGCQLPIADASSAFCTGKSPYNLILINEGASYQVLNNTFQISGATYEYIKCSDEGIKNDRQMVVCTGSLAFSYELKVCDSACRVGTGSVTQCPQEYLYDELRGCCTEEIQDINQGCVVLKLTTPSCVVDCSQYTSKTSCTNHGYYCIWDSAAYECLLRTVR